MNLDAALQRTAPAAQELLAEIDRLPQQLPAGWDAAQMLPLPEGGTPRQVIFAGMGSSALAADLLMAYATPLSEVPLVVNRAYDLPAWVRGPETLVVLISHSGETEETLARYVQAAARGCRVMVIATGGKLLQQARQAAQVSWAYADELSPHMAVSYVFGLLLGLVHRLALIPDPRPELTETVTALQTQQAALRAEIPLMENPAKRMAGQCVQRWVMVFAAGYLAPVARRWEAQINKTAKNWAQAVRLPAANHTTLSGVRHPDAMLPHTMALFLRARGLHERDQLRLELTKEYFMLEGLGTDFVNARGDSPLAEMWTSLHFGEYLAYYLAMAYEEDPQPAAVIAELKRYLAAET